jgi:hypothetical protein
LTDVVLGRSSAMNFRGEPYYFFVFKPEVDVHVSASMLRAGGITFDDASLDPPVALLVSSCTTVHDFAQRLIKVQIALQCKAYGTLNCLYACKTVCLLQVCGKEA